jgi:tetratricopeptide (TPR) repeat protein
MDVDEQRRLAATLFNRVWTLLESRRGRAEDDEMLHAAHASRFHWGEVGSAAQQARGEWQCARVYAVLGRAEPALHHAGRCLDLCREHAAEMEAFDEPIAREALARALVVAGRNEEARAELAEARRLLEAVDDPEDREIVERDLGEVERLIAR